MLALAPLVASAALPDLLEPPPSGGARPEDAAVVIGLERYGFLPAVPHAARDAEAVRTWLVTGAGVPAERVHLRTEGNREQLLAVIDQAVASVGPRGRLWVWFSGHGAASPEGGGLLLLGDDAKPHPTAFAARAVTAAEIEARLAGVPGLLVVDACATGIGRGGEELLPGTRFAVPRWREGGAALTVWTAAEAGGLAEPWPAARHGLFTYLALGALRGWADGVEGAPDGAVTLSEAQAWVARAMAAVGAEQRPGLHAAAPEQLTVPAVEAGPSLAELPPLRPPPVAFTAEPGGPLPPVRYLGGGVFEDAAGRPFDRRTLLYGIQSAEVARTARRENRAYTTMALGGAVTGAAAIGALATLVYHPIREATRDAELALRQACLEAGTGAACGEAPRNPQSLLVTESIWGGVGVVGLGVVMAGEFGRQRNQRQLAEAVTTALSP